MFLLNFLFCLVVVRLEFFCLAVVRLVDFFVWLLCSWLTVLFGCYAVCWFFCLAVVQLVDFLKKKQKQIPTDKPCFVCSFVFFLFILNWFEKQKRKNLKLILTFLHSKELEAEMERELTTNEKKLKDMTSLYHRLKSEHGEMVVSVNLFFF
jgi:hypothetical protein